jgi:predicted O-linked N-acetylglucosamine transferase (SPINDLY family)
MVIGALDDDDTRTSLIENFASHGISPERLSFHARAPLNDYLALYHGIDLVLDTFPYSGGTTTGHAAWMGVPVVTLTGKTMQSRQSAAMLCPIGLDEFVTESEEAFIDCAVRWTGKLQELDDIRRGLRDRITQSPLMDPIPIARGFERALRTMWTRWCREFPVESFEVAP